MVGTKEGYSRAVKLYEAMPIAKLTQEVVRLHYKRYEERDLESYEPHRIASAVLNKRTRSGAGLIFHMNKFLR